MQVGALKVGTRFVDPDTGKHGELLYKNACRARVKIQGPPVTRTFVDKRTGKTVTFTKSGDQETNWPLEVEVTPIEEGTNGTTN